MPRTIEVSDAEVIVRLTGWTAFAALKRELRIPLAAIRSVSTARYTADGIRLGGTSIPFTDIRGGRFRKNGQWAFLSFENRNRVVALDLDRAHAGVGYDRVVLGVDDPVAVSEQIESRLGG